MKTSDATLLLPAAAWRDPRVHLLDDSWLLTIFAILIAIAAPWLTNSFNIGFAAAAGGLLALGAIHLAFTALIDPARGVTGWRTPTLLALHAIGIGLMGFIWHHAGGVQNPAFLLVFALPVIGSIFLSRWAPYPMAALAIAAVLLVAVSQAPELRWYAGGWLASALGTQGAALVAPFPGFYAPSSYFIVMLEGFAILLAGCALGAEYLGTIFERLFANVTLARAAAERSEELWTTLIEQLPLPALLVDTETLQVIGASAPMTGEFAAAGVSPVGHKLFATLRFTFPEPIQGLVAGAGGVAKLAMMRVEGRLRVADVHVRHVAQHGRRFALLILEDRTEAFCIRTALDVSGHAALIVAADGRVLAFNRPALGLFSGTQIGADASQLLGQMDSGARWWEPAFTGRRKMHVEILQRLYQVTSTAVAVPGEEERIYVIALTPIAHGAVADDAASSATVVMPTLTLPIAPQSP